MDKHRMKDHIWHPYTRFSAMANGPLPTMVRGEGVYLFDDGGNRYFDAISSWWACSLGHSHPFIVEAIRSQASVLQHSILGNLSHPPALELAATLDRLAGGNRHVHFASDGAAAVEIAIKACIQYWHHAGHPERHTFISLSNPYHGDTLGAVSVGYMEHFHRAFQPLLFPTISAETPSCSTCRYGADPCDAQCANDIEGAIRRHEHELAGVIVEPLCQGAAGMRMYGPASLTRIQETCAETGVPLILDEVATGFCKTGSMFAFEQAGIAPDILCVGKALSAGSLPISATIVKDKLYDAFSDQPKDNTFYHGHTFAGNPIAAAASLAAIQVYEKDRLAERARQMETLMRDELKDVERLDSVNEARFLGAIAAIELNPGIDLQAIEAARINLMTQEVLIRPLGRVIYLIPPLVSPFQLLSETCRKLSQVLQVLG